MHRPFALPAAMALALGAVSNSAAWSQTLGRPTAASVGVVSGARVRLVVADSGDAPQVGTVAAVQRDGIVFRRERQSDSLTIPFAHLRRLDVSRGRHARPFTGMGIGFAGGALAGAVVGLATYKRSADFFNFGPGLGAAAGAILGGAAGAVMGLITGAFIHTERWRRVPLTALIDHARAGVNLIQSPMGPRLAVGVTARF